ncbi:dynein heavy chain, cytosolic [Trypanosoma rangeli]|uniref:Dynein heavy chain, cytosolic n=1 Tax=Trypanosoma rangeli TaxID=5698 RepID=A0A422NZ91_TRYRA|nr:dynein heavy chain, cytosolic [Trypanosoma rangeli]RNF10741.1 dynein heavy chain, cytosolic [Trypanosoma rangeli]|eukprot:RNF10741.1 dynein heavy chain, cytosolic [Trypanosoma rangeli]
MKRTKKASTSLAACASTPPASFLPVAAAARKGSKVASLSSETLRGGPCHAHVSVNDLVAYEYVDEHHAWQWGLATVAAIPAPRLVQLLRWRHDGALSHYKQVPGGALVPPDERERAVARLEELQHLRARVQEEMEAVQKALAARQVAYAFLRRQIENAASAAEQMLTDVRARISEVEARDWREIRCYPNPPRVVVLVMRAVLTVIGEKCVTWTQIKGVIRSPEFVRTVAQFDPAKLSAATKENIQRQFLSNPGFTYGDAMSGSHALGYLQQWVVAQLETSSTAEKLATYDAKHLNERADITGMEDQLAALQRALQRYAVEEGRLRAMLEGRSTPASNKAGETAHSLLDESAAEDDNDAGDSRTTEDVEALSGTGAIWSFAEDSIVTLHAAILCSYGKSEGMVTRLTAEQVQELKDALKNRDTGLKEKQRADAAHRKLQAALEELRGEHGRTLQRLQELESGKHETQKELERRQRELEKLNLAITEAGVQLHTSRRSSASSPSHLTSRDVRPRTPQLLALSPTDDASMGPLEDEAAVEDSTAKIVDLEQRLWRALHENPTAAQLQLLEDDLRATQEELRYVKEELDKFRTANAPNHYTSSALQMDKAGVPEAQLAAAQRRIGELEVALEEALRQGMWQPVPPLQWNTNGEGNIMVGELQAHIQRLSEELWRQRQDAEDAAEKLNTELHAHEDTRQKLADKQRELTALWDRQRTTEEERESTRTALQENERQREQLRGHLPAQEAKERKLREKLHLPRQVEDQRGLKSKAADKRRAVQLQEVVRRLRDESARQSREANSTEKLLEEVRAQLEAAVMA